MKIMLDRLLVKMAEVEIKTKSGLYLGGNQKRSYGEAQVVEVGSGRKLSSGIEVPLVVKKGDTIIFPPYAGQKVTIKEEEFIILREDEVLAIIEK